jgi:hypothetical protein
VSTAQKARLEHVKRLPKSDFSTPARDERENNLGSFAVLTIFSPVGKLPFTPIDFPDRLLTKLRLKPPSRIPESKHLPEVAT